MKRTLGLILLMAGAVVAAEAPGPVSDDTAAGPVIEVRGKVVRVLTARGQGMPYLELDTGAQTTRVQLGSMRYLMQNGFNPKAGEEAVVEGFEREGDILAIRVRLTGEGRTLELRDEEGRPLWQRGRYGRR